MVEWYWLDGHVAVPMASDAERYAEWDRRRQSLASGDDVYRVARTDLRDGRFVSTVFLGLDLTGKQAAAHAEVDGARRRASRGLWRTTHTHSYVVPPASGETAPATVVRTWRGCPDLPPLLFETMVFPECERVRTVLDVGASDRTA